MATAGIVIGAAHFIIYGLALLVVLLVVFGGLSRVQGQLGFSDLRCWRRKWTVTE